MRKIFEEYVESPDYKVSVFFKELEAQINNWFEDGSFGKQGNQLGQIQTSLTINAMEKYLLFDFTSPENYYQVNFIVRLDDMQNDTQSQGTLGETGDQNPAQAPAQAQQQAPQAQAPPSQLPENLKWKIFEEDENGTAPPVKKNVEVKKVLLKIKKYSDLEKQKLVKELVEEISVEDIKEDFLIEKIAQLEDEKKEKDLEDNIYES